MSAHENDRDDKRELDELQQLRAAWKSVGSPRVDRDLEDEDASTRAAVDWMRGAHSAIAASETSKATAPKADGQHDLHQAEISDPETAATVTWLQSAFAQVQVPAAPASTTAAMRTKPQAALTPRLRLLPALVAGLAAAGLIAYLAGPGTQDRPGPTATNETSVEVALGPDVTAPDSPESIPDQPPAANQQDAVITTDIVDGRIEMRSGPVRLQLFAAAAETQPDEPQASPESSSESNGLPTTK